MVQNLLTDRFNLKVHHENREMPVYELIIAKAGLKAKEWVDPSTVPDPYEFDADPKRGEDGFPLLPPGEASTFFLDGKAWFVAPAGTMRQLASMLERHLSINNPGTPRPVVDGTGLAGKYDLKFWWSRKADIDDSNEGPSMLHALESQLGLKVQPKKSAPVDMLIIDRLDSTPTDK